MTPIPGGIGLHRGRLLSGRLDLGHRRDGRARLALFAALKRQRRGLLFASFDNAFHPTLFHGVVLCFGLPLQGCCIRLPPIIAVVCGHLLTQGKKTGRFLRDGVGKIWQEVDLLISY